MIKKILFHLNAALLIFAATALTGCDDEKSIKYGDLPQQARHFVETYFPGVETAAIIKEKDDGRTTYDVQLADGTDIDFNENGEWESIECLFTTLPDGILPQTITNDITARYPGAKVHGADRKFGGYVVDLNKADGTPLEVRYSATGEYTVEQIDY